MALITGGGSGIGRATAELFAAEGASAVIIVDRDGEGAKATAARIEGSALEGSALEGSALEGSALEGLDGPRGAGGGARCEAIAVEADVTDVDAPSHTVAEATERFGRLDVLMTAAGVSVGRSLPDTSPEDWDHVFAVNVKGTYLWMRAAIPAMVEAGSGSIIAVASQLAINGGRANTAYIASKGAVVAMARTTALDFATKGIRVNSVLPGATETPLLDRSFGRLDDPDAARARSLARHPMHRFGHPDEVAQAALYLASDESSFTTGTEIRVDGGWIAG